MTQRDTATARCSPLGRRHRAHRWGLPAVVLLLAAGLTACGSDDDGGAAGPGDGDVGERCTETVAGSEITYGVYAPTDAIEPTQTSGALVGGTELLAVYDALMIYDYENDTWEPHLAESLEPNDDFTTWTLTLREGITFSDGAPLTAELVSENLDRFFDEGVTNTSAGFMTPITEQNVIDELTLELVLDRSWPEFPFVLADEPGMIVNTDAIGDDLESFAAEPPDEAGVGPYVVERNAPGEEVVMVARDDYWGDPVCIERLRFVFRPGTTYDAFRAGDLDIAFLRDPTDIDAARQESDDNFFVLQDSGETLMINHAEGRPGEDLRVREAIMLAIDENVINDRAFQGLLDVRKALVSSESRFDSDAIEEYPTDPERAQELLDEAVADGYDGSIELLCTTSPAQRPDTALAVSSQLEAIGFNVDVVTLDQSDQIGQVVQSDFDVACWGFNSGPDTGITTFNRTLASDSATNRMLYADDDMDEALLDLFAAASDDELTDAMGDVNDIFHRDAGTLAYGHIEEGVVWAPNVQGIVPTGATMFMFHDAYLAD
jgi:peptide/nickel transport system substrate-binding protein